MDSYGEHSAVHTSKYTEVYAIFLVMILPKVIFLLQINRSLVCVHDRLCYKYFYKKLRIWVTTESFLKLSAFEHSEFLMSFLKVP